LSERRLKRSPLRDVVAMLRSFHYAVYTALAGASGGPPLGISRAERLAGLNVAEAGGPPTHGMIRPADVAVLEPWGHFWYQWVGATFLKGYFAATGETFLFPPARDDLRTLFQAFLLERAVYELGYELNQQRDQVAIPLLALLQMLEPAPETQQAAL
jgi:maltose alpha-D-glucosyltransferase/alpha-amylase